MEPISILLIAVGLAMDAFAVSICKGMAVKRASFRTMLVIRKRSFTVPVA